MRCSTKDCFSAVCTVGFDPYQGFYHTGRHGRPSLALDLMEEFRPVIADSVVLTLINNGMLADARTSSPGATLAISPTAAARPFSRSTNSARRPRSRTRSSATR